MYKIEKNEKDKSYFIEEIGHAMSNRPDLYCKAYMALQDRYQEEGRVLFFELANFDLETLQLLLEAVWKGHIANLRSIIRIIQISINVSDVWTRYS